MTVQPESKSSAHQRRAGNGCTGLHADVRESGLKSFTSGIKVHLFFVGVVAEQLPVSTPSYDDIEEFFGVFVRKKDCQLLEDDLLIKDELIAPFQHIGDELEQPEREKLLLEKLFAFVDISGEELSPYLGNDDVLFRCVDKIEELRRFHHGDRRTEVLAY